MTRGMRFLPVALLTTAMITGCSSSDEPTAPTTSPGPFLVSNPVQAEAFISLPPGSLPDVAAVRIVVRNRPADPVLGDLVEGGMDPVAVRASAGDILLVTPITVSGEDRSEPPYALLVPDQKPPQVIRTNPRGDERDVWVTRPVQIVFSEPVDLGSFTAQAFQLSAGGIPVQGAFRFANRDHTRIEFWPATRLLTSAEYELVIRQGIHDLQGMPLVAETSLTFTTSSTLPPVPTDQQLAFVRDNQIHLINPDGTGLVQLTHTGPGIWNGDPAWSPDGQRLAFSSNRDGLGQGFEGEGLSSIYVMNADGSNVVRRTPGGRNHDPAWSSDGRTIAFTGQREGSDAILAVNADGQMDIKVLLNRPGYDAYPAWSPDGRRITFTSDWRAYDFVYDLYVMDSDGSNVEPLLLGPFFAVDTNRYFFQSAWSPDGQKIAAVRCTWAWENCYPSSEIVVANADGSNLHVIAQTSGYARPTWSPDGSTIAFSRRPCGRCQVSLRFARVDGSGEGLIVITNGHSAAWRPALPSSLRRTAP